jgi:hypothetical protein
MSKSEMSIVWANVWRCTITFAVTLVLFVSGYWAAFSDGYYRGSLDCRIPADTQLNRAQKENKEWLTTVY